MNTPDPIQEARARNEAAFRAATERAAAVVNAFFGGEVGFIVLAVAPNGARAAASNMDPAAQASLLGDLSTARSNGTAAEKPRLIVPG